MDQLRKDIVTVISGEAPKPWELFSDETILDAVATLKMGCDLHPDKFYNHVGERTGRVKLPRGSGAHFIMPLTTGG